VEGECEIGLFKVSIFGVGKAGSIALSFYARKFIGYTFVFWIARTR
jgi:hypothetical protein